MKVLKILGIGVGSVLVLGLVVTGSLWGLDKWNSRPRDASELELGGFKLGESKSDVEFKHGDITSGYVVKDNRSVAYRIGESLISFDRNNLINIVKYDCISSKYETDYTIINNVKCSDSSAKIEQLFPHIKQYCLTDKRYPEDWRKVYREYRDYEHNTTYLLLKNSVSTISIWKSAVLAAEDKGSWSLCK